MSFSTEVKKELINNYIISDKNKYATFLSLIIKYKTLEKNNQLIFETYNYELAKAVAFIVEQEFSQRAQVKVRSKKGIEPDDLIQLTFEKEEEMLKIIPIIDQENVNFLVLILLFGYFVDPNKYYSFELKLPFEIPPLKIQFINQIFNIKLKKIPKKNVYYLKDGEEIANILIKYKLKKALFTFEDIRIMKDMRNNYNRQDNFYIANEVKKQNKIKDNIKIIQKIEQNEALKSNLTDKEKQIIAYRKEYLQASLAELSKIMQDHNIKISKTAISNFFTKYKNF